VFGLALSIGALTLIAKPPATASDISNDLMGFGFSFIILISVWLRYTSIMSILPVGTGTTVLLNVALLFLVSIEPYLLSLLNLAEYTVFAYASVLYALDLAGLMAILALFTNTLTIEEKKLVPISELRHQRIARNALFLSTLLFLVSALPQFLSWNIQGTPIRVLLWYGSLVVTWSVRLTRIQRKFHNY
jgi:uncharacterized membrane protein